jgi:hypothetical protein
MILEQDDFLVLVGLFFLREETNGDNNFLFQKAIVVVER